MKVGKPQGIAAMVFGLILLTAAVLVLINVPSSADRARNLATGVGLIDDPYPRYAELRESGVTSLNINLVGRTLAERLKTLDGLQELIATM